MFATRPGGLFGVKVAILLATSYVTTPFTGVTPGPASVNVPLFIVVGSIGLLNVALTALLSGTPVALFTGFVRIIVGGVGSVVVPTVKVQGFGTGLTAAKALPARSCAPDVTCAVYTPAARLLVGLKDAVVPP